MSLRSTDPASVPAAVKDTYVLGLGWKPWAVIAILLWYFTHRENQVYLLDFTTFEPPSSWKLSPEQLLEAMRFQGCFTEESLEFMGRMLKQSGVGPSTAWPPGIVRCLEGIPADRSVEGSRKEAEVI